MERGVEKTDRLWWGCKGVVGRSGGPPLVVVGRVWWIVMGVMIKPH